MGIQKLAGVLMVSLSYVSFVQMGRLTQQASDIISGLSGSIVSHSFKLGNVQPTIHWTEAVVKMR